MYVTTPAIVLSKLRYNESDLIVKCFTWEEGVKSYILKGVLKAKKSRIKAAYFQPFSLLELVANHKPGRALNYIKEVKILHPTSNIQTDITKSTVAIFLTEILSGILKEETHDKALFEFLQTSIIWFETHEGHSQFHLLFLIELTKYLGFYPTIDDSKAYFDLLEGRSTSMSLGPYICSDENLTLLKQALGIKFDAHKKIQMSSPQKRGFLDMILLYFKLHLDGFKEPRSLSVLNQVFS